MDTFTASWQESGQPIPSGAVDTKSRVGGWSLRRRDGRRHCCGKFKLVCIWQPGGLCCSDHVSCLVLVYSPALLAGAVESPACSLPWRWCIGFRVAIVGNQSRRIVRFPEPGIVGLPDAKYFPAHSADIAVSPQAYISAHFANIQTALSVRIPQPLVRMFALKERLDSSDCT